MDIDEDALFRYVSNVIYPHSIDEVVTTGEAGVAASARGMASSREKPLVVCDQRRMAMDAGESVCIFRYSDEGSYDSQYCSRRGRVFKEYVVKR